MIGQARVPPAVARGEGLLQGLAASWGSQGTRRLQTVGSGAEAIALAPRC